MKLLNLPTCNLKIKIIDGEKLIWDIYRKKYIFLTPEEWVRQHFAYYLSDELGYPKSLLKLEVEIKYNKRKKRPDIVAYNRDGTVFLIVECKASNISISKNVFEQIMVYNKSLNAKYLVVTNGMEHYCCERNETGTFHFVQKIPVFPTK